MGRAATLVVIVGLTGCAQLFGIDSTSGPSTGDDAAPPPSSSLKYQRISVGAQAVRSPLDVTANTAVYLVPDMTDPSGIRRVPVTQTATDTWTAPLDAAAPIFFDLPDIPTPIKRIFDFPVQNLFGLFGVLEHPNPQPAPAGATLTINVGLNPVYNSELLRLFTVGSWNLRDAPAGEVAVGAGAWNVTFPFSSVSSQVGRPLEQLTTDDAIYLLRYGAGTSDLQGFLEVPPFTQSVSDTITGTVSPNPHDRTLAFTVGTATVATRFAATRPAMTNLAMSWSVVAAPGYQIVSNAGPVLQAAGVAPGADSINVTYGNPFVADHDWPDVVTWSTAESRTFTPPALGLPVTPQAGMFQLVFPTAGMNLDLPAGLPITLTMNGTALTTDGATMTVDPAKAVSVSFVADAQNNTLFQLQLFELVPNSQTAPTALVYLQKLGATGSKPAFTLPPELFEVGKTYVLRAICIQGGFPTIAMGDLTNRTPPQAVSFLDGAVFTVAAP
jgi:hypothetical protein